MVGSLEGEVAMDLLLPFVLPALLFLLLQWLWVRPSWLRRPEGTAPEPPGPAADRDPFALPSIRRRIAALTEELERLDRDRTVFALAFRTRVARYAYEALVADAARLSATATIEVEYVVRGDQLREELDV